MLLSFLFIFAVSITSFGNSELSFTDLALIINNDLIQEFVMNNSEKYQSNLLKECDCLISSQGIVFYEKNSTRIIDIIINKRINTYLFNYF